MTGWKSDWLIVCAGQRVSQEGSSPSGARMRRAVSKGEGNASPASGRSRWKTGCPERSGSRRLTWDAFNQIKERTPLLKPKLRLPYRELQALAVL
jgi:hypothetical protein